MEQLTKKERINMLVNVKVWGNDLDCDVCSNDKW